MGGVGDYERPIGRGFGVFHWSVLKKRDLLPKSRWILEIFSTKNTKQDNTTRRLRPS
jgi:hypothetical protein